DAALRVHQRYAWERGSISGDGAHALGHHWVPLERHRARPDLGTLDRLGELSERGRLEYPKVESKLVAALPDRGERREYQEIDFERVRAGRDIECIYPQPLHHIPLERRRAAPPAPLSRAG